MTFDHIRQNIREALDCLVGAGDLETRLQRAALPLITPSPNEILRLPEDVRGRFDAVLRALTAHPPEHSGEGTIGPSIRHMLPDQRVHIAREILSIYAAVSRHT